MTARTRTEYECNCCGDVKVMEDFPRSWMKLTASLPYRAKRENVWVDGFESSDYELCETCRSNFWKFIAIHAIEKKISKVEHQRGMDV